MSTQEEIITKVQTDAQTINSNFNYLNTEVQKRALSSSVGNADLIIQKNSTPIGTFSANATSAVTVSIPIPTTVAELSDSGNYALKSDIASAIIPKGSISAVSGLPTLVADHRGWMYNFDTAFTTTSDFVEGSGLYYPAGTNVVVVEYSSGTYKYDVFSGFVDTTTYDNHIADTTIHVTSTEKSTWSGKQDTITSSNKLSADLISDGTTNKTVTQTEKNTWSGKQDAITSSNKLSADLISDGITNKTVTQTEKSTWNGKQDVLVSGTNIKTINNESLLGNGNITISGGGGSSPSRNVGEVVTSTIPLTDAGLHLLDGVLLQSGSYADFVTYIAGIYSSNHTLFTTESAWQTEVTNTGYCDKFVYNSTNNTVRLPKWGSQLITNLPSTAGVKGNGKVLGLTDGTNNASLSVTNGAMLSNSAPIGSVVGTSGTSYPITSSGTKQIGVTTDADKSGVITDLSGITKANVYYYIVIANTTKTAIEVDIDEITTDLNGKADNDLSNINASSSAKKMIDNWGTPDYSSGVSMGLPAQPTSATTTTYTCPSAGVCVIAAYQSTSGSNLFVDVNNVNIITHVAYNAMGVTTTFPVSKNDVVKAYTNYAGYGWAMSTQTFFPLKGEA